MFTRIRNRLTLQYTVIMMAVLVAFILASSAGLLWILYQEERDDLLTFAEEKVRVQEELYKEDRAFFQPSVKGDDNAEGTKIFYYVFDSNQKLAASEAPVPKIRKDIMITIQNWDSPHGEASLKKFLLENGDDGVAIMCSMAIKHEGKQVGTLYVGEDISEYYQMLISLFIMMLLVGMLFLVITAVVGHFMAGKAMVPIQQAFLRQREFVADASHELRTPISIFQASVEVVESDRNQVLSPFSQQVLADMKSEIRRMTKLVADLLTLARADSGVANIMKENIDIVAIAEPIVRSAQALAIGKEITLTMDGEKSLAVMADRERIGQLILILVDNAIKYTPNGGRVDVSIAQVAGTKPMAMIRVRDTGIGIDEAEQKLIFKRFYRVDKVRSREQGGVGLGLSIAKWIIDAHRGRIKVESKKGIGSTFIITLPLS